MKQFRRILCVVDPIAKRQSAVARAFELAGRHGAKLKLVDVVDTSKGWLGLMLSSHVELLEQERRSRLAAWNTPGEELLVGRMPDDRLLEYIEKTQRMARQGLDHSLRHLKPRIEAEHLHFHKGNASSVVLQTASEVEADVLILGTVARNLKSLLMGNTADTVLRQITGRSSNVF